MSDDIETDEDFDIDEVLAQISALREEHRRLDDEITALYTQGVTDMMKIARMKKQKLKLKDRIAHLTDLVNPDIIA